MKVLLSIKPEFAELIFDNSKKYEFRKTIFKNTEIKTIIVYSSSPVQRIIGEFEIDHILSDTPENLWETTQEHSGISKNSFFEYFSKKNTGFAIKVKNALRYETPRCLQECYNIKPPQSFCYV